MPKLNLVFITVPLVLLLCISLRSLTFVKQGKSAIVTAFDEEGTRDDDDDELTGFEIEYSNEESPVAMPWTNEHHSMNNNEKTNEDYDAPKVVTKAEIKSTSKTGKKDWIQLLLEASASNKQQQPRPTVLVQLTGGMGDQLGKIAHGVSIALWMYKEHNLMPRLVLKHDRLYRKRLHSANVIQKCFPNLKPLDFHAGDDPNLKYNERIKAQYNNPLYFKLDFAGVSSTNEKRVDHAIRNYVELWTNMTTSSDKSANVADNDKLPFLFSNHVAMFDVFFDRYYNELREFLRFGGGSGCCGVKPQRGESVFYYRNYLQEIPRKGLEKGLEELGPEEVATRVYKDIKPNYKLAMMTIRFSVDDNESITPYVKAVQAHHNITVRVLPHQRGARDFCYLMNINNEAVGGSKSIFFIMAMLLGGRAKKVRVYSVDSVHRRRSHGRNVFTQYKWRYSEELRKRFQFELYAVNESYVPAHVTEFLKNRGY